jgi:hypothetical protein
MAGGMEKLLPLLLPKVEARQGICPLPSLLSFLEANCSLLPFLLPFASCLLPLEMEAAAVLLPFASSLLPSGMEAGGVLLPFASTPKEETPPFCFHLSRAAFLKSVEMDPANLSATARSGSPVVS